MMLPKLVEVLNASQIAYNATHLELYLFLKLSKFITSRSTWIWAKFEIYFRTLNCIRYGNAFLFTNINFIRFIRTRTLFRVKQKVDKCIFKDHRSVHHKQQHALRLNEISILCWTFVFFFTVSFSDINNENLFRFVNILNL